MEERSDSKEDAWVSLAKLQADAVARITDERGERYGDFRGHAMVSQKLKTVTDDALSDNPQFAAMPPMSQMIVREGLAMVLHKIARIVNGDPTYDDSWIDIEGYSKITRERVCKTRSE
jgi:hypothetical protein